jgi:hypothetical protein
MFRTGKIQKRTEYSRPRVPPTRLDQEVVRQIRTEILNGMEAAPEVPPNVWLSGIQTFPGANELGKLEAAEKKAQSSAEHRPVSPDFSPRERVIE